MCVCVCIYIIKFLSRVNEANNFKQIPNAIWLYPEIFQCEFQTYMFMFACYWYYEPEKWEKVDTRLFLSVTSGGGSGEVGTQGYN